MAKCKMTPTPAEDIARQIMEAYQPKDAQEIQDAVKQIFAPIFEAALKGEMDNHLGCSSHERSEMRNNSRNGYSEKTLKTSLGELPIHVPRDRKGDFEPQIVKKHQRDVTSIEGKILAMYGRGMSQRDIASTIEDIYGFKISHITDCVMEEVRAWQNRPLSAFYPFVFVDCLYVSLCRERGAAQAAVHVHSGASCIWFITPYGTQQMWWRASTQVFARSQRRESFRTKRRYSSCCIYAYWNSTGSGVGARAQSVAYG